MRPHGTTTTALIVVAFVAATIAAIPSGPASALVTNAPTGTASAATMITAGDQHSCASLDGAVRCWGRNAVGELGLGDGETRGDEPYEMGASLAVVDLGDGRTATALDAGTTHTCALLDNDAVRCWGYNMFGELGVGDGATRGNNPGEMGDDLPEVDLGPGRTAVAITAGGGHSCAVLDDSMVKCWGGNYGGALGLGDTLNRASNFPVVDLGPGRTATAITAGSNHTCAILDDGTVKCWGYNGEAGGVAAGQLGLGDTINRGDDPHEMGANLPPVDLGPDRTATAITAGTNHTCAILDDDTTKCWGFNATGQLGLGDTINRGDDPDEMGANLPPVDLGPGRTATAITAGTNHTCAALDNGTIKCWGANLLGRLGLGDTINRGDDPDEMGANLPPVDLRAPCPTTPHGFTDVAASSFAAADIACIKALGITTGTSPTTYDPTGSVTREQMAAFLARTWRTHNSNTAWVSLVPGD
ncbi:MAG: S-layer homology domain-containing protein [Acidimicrobiales bacterium]